MEFVSVKSEVREIAGKKGAKSVRRQGLVPGVIYGGDEILHFSVKPLDLRDIIYTPEFRLAELEINGEKIKCILKDVQFNPVTDEIVHVDFLRLVDDRKIKIEVPIKFEGTAPGLKSGGKMIQKLRRVKILALPKDLVDHLVLDISELELGFSVRVRDLKEENGVEVLNNTSIPVASIEIPRALKSAAAGAEEDGEGEGEGAEEGAEAAAAE